MVERWEKKRGWGRERRKRVVRPFLSLYSFILIIFVKSFMGTRFILMISCIYFNSTSSCHIRLVNDHRNLKYCILNVQLAKG